MTNKLVVVINRLKYQKFRKCYHMKWNFLYQITDASRTPDYGATAPRSPFSLSSVLNWICWTPPPNKIPGYATGASYRFIASCYYVRITYCQGSNSRHKKEDTSLSDRSLQQPAIFLFSNRRDLTTCSLGVLGFPNLCQHITHREGIPHRIHSRIYANIKEN